MLCYGLSSQEQISDIDNYDIVIPTELDQKLKFTLIDGHQYLIEDHKGIKISKWRNGSFEMIHELEDLYPDKKKLKSNNDFEENFIVVGHKYIRITDKTLEIIDIVSGVRERNIDYTPFKIYFWKINDVIGSRILLTANRLDENRLLVFDLEVGRFIYLPNYFFKVSYKLLEDRVVYINEDSSAIGEWRFIDRSNKRIFNSVDGINTMTISDKNQSITILEESGSIHRLFGDGTNVTFNCEIKNILPDEDFHFLTDRYIRINNGVSIWSKPDVEFVNLNTCRTENSIWPDTNSPNFSNNIKVTQNRDGEESFTIVGQLGSIFGVENIFIVNHNDYSVTPFEFGDLVKNGSPVIHNGNLYFTSIDYLDFSYYDRLIVKHDLNTKETKVLEPDPNLGLGLSAIVGYEEGELIVAINTYHENPAIYTIDDNDLFNDVQALSYDCRLGFYRIDNVSVHNKELYINSRRQISKVGNSSRLLSTTREIYSRFPSYDIIGFTKYDNRVAYGAHDASDSLMIYTYDNSSQSLDSLRPPSSFYNSVSHIKNVGPLLISGSDFYDLRDNAFGAFDIDISLYKYAIGKDKLTFRKSNAYEDNNIGVLDIESLEIDTFDFSFINPEIFSGHENTAYIIDAVESNHFELYFLNTIGDLELLYVNDNASFVSNSGNAFSNQNFIKNEVSNRKLNSFEFIDRDTDRVVIVSHDTNTTFINEYENTTNNTYNTIIYDEWDDGYLVKGNTTLTFLNTATGLNNIYTLNPTESFQTVLVQADSIVVFTIFDTANFSSEILKYNMVTQEIESRVDINPNIDCAGISLSAFLSDDILLCSCYNSYYDNKPAVLNISDGSLGSIDNANPNLDYLLWNLAVYNIDNYIYFPAYVNDGSIQWFRVDKTNYNLVPESEEEETKRIITIPSVSNNTIFIEESLEDVRIVNRNGDLVERYKSYEKGTYIDVANFAKGVYYIMSVDVSSGQVRQGSFVRM